MTGKTSTRVGEARDTAISHYVFEAPVRLLHWLTVGCMLVLMVTGYFIGRPLPSVSG
ncbi:hydrogenase 1 b-type cytochrome subunit, partial [Escherichia coli]|nr:hydrogenase 1 b-type cytochrome subunit [Escherichia coli]